MKKVFGTRGREGGFDLIEIVIATGIISVTLVSVVTLATHSMVISRRSLDTYQATTLLEEGAEAIRIVRDAGWSNISSLSEGVTYYPFYDTGTDTWALSTSDSDGLVGPFTRSLVVGNVLRDGLGDISVSGDPDVGTRLVTLSVSWRERDGAIVTRTMSLYLTDIFS